MAGKRLQDRATERVAVLMTPAEKSAVAERASSLGMSLGQFFREAGAAYVNRESHPDSLDAVLTQLELSTSRAERALDSALSEVRAAFEAQACASPIEWKRSRS